MKIKATPVAPKTPSFKKLKALKPKSVAKLVSKMARTKKSIRAEKKEKN